MLLEFPKFEQIYHLVRSVWNPEFIWAQHFLKRTNDVLDDSQKPWYSGGWWDVLGLRIG